MAQRPISYADWKAPAEDGALLIWPQPDELLRQTADNHRRLTRNTQVRIASVPLSEVRSRLRRYVGHHDDRPLLASGHQTELYHPGVWVKDVLVNAVASRIGGMAIHLAVDTDAPKHLALRWPGEAMPVTDDPKLTAVAWSGLLDAPSPAHLESLASQFNDASSRWSFRPMLARVLDSLRRLSLETANLSAALTNVQHELDWELGLRHHALLASPIWMSEPFLLLAYHILANADSFAADYNAALRAYRVEHGIGSPSRPMPDLFVGDDAIEMPFWLDDLSTGRRSRPSVFRGEGSFVLQLLGGETFTFDRSGDGWEGATRLARFFATTAHRLAPRALTLTMFARLCLADQFVHGIGGGRYDQVTDQLIARHFQIEPPHFAVTTATLFFPEAVGRQRVCVPCVRHEGHRLRHSILGPRKRQLVAQIESLPRRSPQRKATFLDMHNQLDAAAERPAMARWRAKMEETLRQYREEQAMFDRELFYALQPEDRLKSMIQKYNSAFDL